MSLQDENLSSHQGSVKLASRVWNARESESLSHGQPWGPRQTPGLRVSPQASLRAHAVSPRWLESALAILQLAARWKIPPCAESRAWPGPNWKRQNSVGQTVFPEPPLE